MSSGIVKLFLLFSTMVLVITEEHLPPRRKFYTVENHWHKRPGHKSRPNSTLERRRTQKLRSRSMVPEAEMSTLPKNITVVPEHEFPENDLCPVIHVDPEFLPGICHPCIDDANCYEGRVCCTLQNVEERCCLNPIVEPSCPQLMLPRYLAPGLCRTCYDIAGCCNDEVCCNIGNLDGRGCCFSLKADHANTESNLNLADTKSKKRGSSLIPPTTRKKEFILDQSKKTFNEALLSCASKNEKLAVIRDHNTQMGIVDTLKEMNLDTDVWIGLKAKTNAEFEWATGELMPGIKDGRTYHFWHSDYPQEYVKQPHSTCVALSFENAAYTAVGRWIESNCEKQLYHLCEQQLKKT